MPLYEYVCNKCAKRTEVIQRMGDAPLKVCPHCGGRLKKAISAPAIQFKGSGWYVTDYARGSKEGGSGKKESESSGESKSEKSESAGKSEKVEKKGEKKAEKKKASSD
ncbi:MAG TPA: FmdB family zinc ribbon protein [Thermoanaerobaculia bacterium]|nr:FmdB family zinc ribbon protein [Thermoanaerobaculia bacterium]